MPTPRRPRGGNRVGQPRSEPRPEPRPNLNESLPNPVVRSPVDIEELRLRQQADQARVYANQQERQQSQQRGQQRGNQVGRQEQPLSLQQSLLRQGRSQQPQQQAINPVVTSGGSADLPGGYTSPEAEQRLLARANETIRRGNRVGSVPPSQPSPSQSLPSQPNSSYPNSPYPSPYSSPHSFGDPIPLRTQQEFVPDPDAVQLRLDLGWANAPMTMEQLRQIRQDTRSSRTGDRIAGMMRLPDGKEVVHQTYNTQVPQSTWVETNSGPMLVDSNKLNVIYKAGNQVKSGLIEQSALPIAQPRPGLLNNITAGLKTGFNVFTGIEPGDNTHFSHSVFQLLNPQFRQRYNDALEANQLSIPGKAAAAVGGVAGDMAKFGTISRLLWRSNAMDLMDTYGVPLAATAAGADPMDKPAFKRYAIPLALGAGLATHVASGNLNPFKIFNTDEGPRVDGYKAEYSGYDTPTQTDNYLLALYNQALPGGGARLLPWDQFHEERPDVSYDQYMNYQNYLWGERGLQLLGGGIKATNESIDAPEDAWAIDPRRYEVRAGGYRITPIGLAAGLGALTLGGMAIRNKVRANRMAELMKQGLNERQAAQALMHQHKPVYKVPENIELL